MPRVPKRQIKKTARQSPAPASPPKKPRPRAAVSGARAVPPTRAPKKAPPPKRTGLDPARFPVVGIGASAGGLEALEQFFANVEPASGMAYVVVTHQAPGRTSLLAEILAKKASIVVTTAGNRMKLRPNQVYVCPPGGCLSIHDETLMVEATEAAAKNPPVDHFFRSLAANDGDNAIGIILSGSGSDGTLGVTAIKENFGMVMAQEPSSARYVGMPSSAIGTLMVDYVLPPGDMPAQLLRYARDKSRLGSPDVEREEPEPDVTGMFRVLATLRTRTGHDFSEYKKSTVRRRIERRMTVHSLASLAEYTKFIQRAPHEVDALFRDLLISVTSFFRDPEAFEALRVELDKVIKEKEDDAPLRAWVAGCATGEEAYSLAILIKEILIAQGRRLTVQIFATDLDGQAVETARAGRYPEGIAADVSAERLERFFIKDDHGYRVTKEIRESLIFASQNLVKDPPFTKLDLLTCRNLLIYLESELQKRILWLFNYSIRDGGLLLLGTSESVSGFDDLFEVVDKKWKVFLHRDGGKRTVPAAHARLPQPAVPGMAILPTRAAHRMNPGMVHVAERVLIGSFVPPSVLMSERGELIYLHGRTGPFLEPAPGEPSNNVFNMAREGLRLELPAAVRQAAGTDDPVVRRNLQVKTNGGFSAVRLTVRKLREPEALKGAFMASFEIVPDEPKQPSRRTAKTPGVLDERVTNLEQELQRTKENLQGTIEELETSNEELKSTNEELQSTNEELQSANEELETSREEMQSLNEELQTVNSELEERNHALSQANDDMQNLLNSTDIATVFLDEKLAIKRFTTQAKKVFSLIEGDIGRPIADLAANLRYDNLVDEATEVLQTLAFREREIQTKDGAWRLMRVMPYRRHDNLIDGLVITFVDIDRVKRAEEEAQQARVYAEGIVESMRSSLLVLNQKLRVISANGAFYDQFGMSSKLVIGESLTNLASGRWNVPPLTDALHALFNDNEAMKQINLTLKLPRERDRRVRINAHRLPTRDGEPLLALLLIESADSDGARISREGIA
ncbi:MAG TPA: chemotaxis protein CheB [Polyangiaceae bacterium]|jgi:two-component system CheB/CheR fusion protein|nr:chemotaxis protein CheB [Polyangiaceae bacterium]